MPSVAKLVVAFIVVVLAILFGLLPFLFPDMIGRSPFLQKFREANNQLFLGGKKVLVIGGTGGIGAAAAVRFAQLGADVTIAGRTQESGDAVVAKMRNAAPQRDGFAPEFAFKKLDITLMSDINRFSKDYTESLGDQGLNMLVITSGGLNLAARRDTPEGIEYNFALCYLGRFLVINRLMPALLRADGARAISVLSAGRAAPIDLDDVEMKKDYSKSKSERYNSISNDYMMEEFTKRYSGKRNISFFHVAPGIVATDIYKNSGGSGTLSSCLKSLSGLLGQQPEEYAENLVYIATSPELTPLSGKGLTRDATPTKRIAEHDAPGASEKLWAYSAEVSGLTKNPDL